MGQSAHIKGPGVENGPLIYYGFQEYRKSLIEKTADQLIDENLEAFQELAK